MVEKLSIKPGITLLHHADARFKHGFMSLQFVRPMCAEEATMNVLVPAVLLRGCKSCPDLRSISHRLDLYYGATVSPLVRRIGDYQGTGLYCSFIEDRFALPGDRVLAPLADFLAELLFEPVTQEGVFSADFVESEKRNLLASIDAQRNDKRYYAESEMLRAMCRSDSYGVPRLGEREMVDPVTPAGLYEHYRRLLSESRVEIFYAGSCPADDLIAMLQPLLSRLEARQYTLPPQTPLHDVGGKELSETMEVAQGKLSMGFVTPITARDPRFAAMQVLNGVFGASMVSKLFMVIREKLSLCYDIGSTYYSSKGVLVVNAGIDAAMEKNVREQVLQQLEGCRNGQISELELNAAKQAILSGLRCVKDTPGSIESYANSLNLGAQLLSPEQYAAAVEALTVDDVAAAAKTVKEHTVYFLKGVSA